MFIIVISIVVLAAIFYFLDCITYVEECECKHPNFARYESRKEQICIDCGLKLPLTQTHLPKHQR